MLCNQCKEREATVHLTQIVGSAVSRTDLCEACATPLFGHRLPFTGTHTKSPAFDDLEAQLDAIVARDSRFAKEDYRLVLAAIEKAFADPDKPPNHISAKELLEFLRLHATETFGPDAKSTLHSWGVYTCEDFGEIVYNLIDRRLLTKRPPDSKDDFRNGYDFDSAFPK